MVPDFNYGGRATCCLLVCLFVTMRAEKNKFWKVSANRGAAAALRRGALAEEAGGRSLISYVLSGGTSYTHCSASGFVHESPLLNEARPKIQVSPGSSLLE